ncbi:MAG: hypothetical protein V3S10_01375 [Dehalococcoidales bacterium]
MTGPGHPASRRKQDRDWQRHCGFVGLSTARFMIIRETLLLQQVELVAAGV